MLEYSLYNNIYYINDFTRFFLITYKYSLQFSYLFYSRILLAKYSFGCFLDKYFYIFLILPNTLAKIAFLLKNHLIFLFDILSDIIINDFFFKKLRFQVNYIFLSIFYNMRLTVRLNIAELQGIDSITNYFKVANWYEREVWDMFGVWINYNKDMRRILTDYGFWGHPLRKDFPLTGFWELYYDEFFHIIKYTTISLQQLFRIFKTDVTWKTYKMVDF
jgi:NADH:ubiquinone oxidoreductase subunit C